MRVTKLRLFAVFAPCPEPPSFLEPVTSRPLWVVPGNPRLLVGGGETYESRDTGFQTSITDD